MTLSEVFRDRSVRLYLGDAFELLADDLADDSVAAVLTDVPYASGTRAEAKKNSSGAMLRGGRFAKAPLANDQMTTPGFVWMLREFARAARMKLVEGGSFATFIDWRQYPNLIGALESADLRLNQVVVWDKEVLGLGNGFRSQHEFLVHTSRGVPRICSRSTGNVLRCRRSEETEHPSPKPVALLERILEVITEPGDLVVDPFAGSGSTLVACRNIGRRAIGVEIDPTFAEVARNRLQQKSLFGDLS